MKKTEKISRIINIILCCANIGSIFYWIMTMSGGGNAIYRIFNRISWFFSLPMLIMRFAYLQYILWGIIAVLSILCFAYNVKTKNVTKKAICIDTSLWVIAVMELVFLESYYEAVITF